MAACDRPDSRAPRDAKEELSISRVLEGDNGPTTAASLR